MPAGVGESKPEVTRYNATNGLFKWRPETRHVGSHKITVTLNGDTAGAKTFTVAVKPTNPVLGNVTSSLTPEGNKLLTITGKYFGDKPQDGIKPADGQVKFSPSGVFATDFVSWSDTEIKCLLPAAAGTGTVQVQASGLLSSTVSITTSGHAPMVYKPSDRSARVGELVRLNVSAVDIDLEKPLTFAFSLVSGTLPVGVGTDGMPRIDAATGVITWRPEASQVSKTPYEFTVTVTDPTNLSDSKTFKMTINS